MEVKLEVSDMVFLFAPGSRSRDQKNTSKNTTIRHLDFHLQNPNLPEPRGPIFQFFLKFEFAAHFISKCREIEMTYCLK